MLLESFLSFLGLGVPAEMSSWGSLIKDGVVSMQSYPWILIFSGLTFSITLFALNFFGDVASEMHWTLKQQKTKKLKL